MTFRKNLSSTKTSDGWAELLLLQVNALRPGDVAELAWVPFTLHPRYFLGHHGVSHARQPG